MLVRRLKNGIAVYRNRSRHFLGKGRLSLTAVIRGVRDTSRYLTIAGFVAKYSLECKYARDMGRLNRHGVKLYRLVECIIAGHCKLSWTGLVR